MQDISFLSCLYGSERKPLVQRAMACFLSCLYGSEPEQSTPITLSNKEFP